MRSLFAGLTTRGRAFLAAGVAAALFGLAISQPTLLSIGGLLAVLPLLSALVASRGRYRIRCTRDVAPARVPAGQVAMVSISLDNTSRLPTGLLLAEDALPYELGSRPRFVLDRIEPGGSRVLSYRVTPDHRGRFLVGPLHLRVADTFGLVRLAAATTPTATLTVTPAVTSLAQATLAGIWLGEGGSRASSAALAGEDDVVPRPYRDGDELRRVHWRSTARRGELMVRREEQRWRNRATLFLDTRSAGHAGRGPSSSFEFAVAAAASIGVHLAREEIDGELVTDVGMVRASGPFEDVLLDTLAVIQPSRSRELTAGLADLPRKENGLLVAVLGHLNAGQAQELAVARPTAGPAMALLLDVPTWSDHHFPASAAADTPATATILRSAGWRVATVKAGTPLRTAWQALTHHYQPAGRQPMSPGPARGVAR
jgi:uncharacterized protein (DUF58 family)